MSRILPILFNTDMVQAILHETDPKTATRRIVRYKYDNTEMKMITDKYGTRLIEIQKDIEGETYGKRQDGKTWHKLLPCIEKRPPCRAGDILYVRETWNFVYDTDGNDKIIEESGRYVYYADDPMQFSEWIDPNTGEHKDYMPWKPSIHMPKRAARIWLRVKSVKPQRINEITLDDFLKEGVILRPEAFNDPDNAYLQAKEEFIRIWESTLKGPDKEHYAWAENPWVWAIEFERCNKPEQL